MEKPEPWSSVDEVAAHLGASRDTVYRWIENAGLPASKVGRSWKLKLTAVDKWVRSGVAGKGPAPRRAGTRG